MLKNEDVKSVDVEKLLHENRRLKEIIAKQTRLLSYGRVSNLSSLIDEYMMFSRTQLKKIDAELSLVNCFEDDAEKVTLFIEYLQHSHEVLLRYYDPNAEYANPTGNMFREEWSEIMVLIEGDKAKQAVVRQMLVNIASMLSLKQDKQE